jgi:[acyl-carrier-protein] S-malonyltransferase
LKTAWIFPGQGSQHVGMGEDLHERSELAKEYFEISKEILGFDIQSIIFNGPEDLLNKTKYTQPSIFITSVIIGKILIERGLQPFAVAGHSLGEYSALTVSDSVSFEKGLELVKVRSESMEKAGHLQSGTMAAIVGLEENEVQLICSSYKGRGLVVIANHNSPKQIVISGTSDAVIETIEKAKNQGAKLAMELKVSGAFHSPLMNPAKEALAKVLDSINFKDPQYPVFNNVNCKPIFSSNKIRNSLLEQLEKPVLWNKSIIEMKNFGVKSFLEVGPGKVLQGLNKRIDRSLISDGVDSFHKMDSFFV